MTFAVFYQSVMFSSVDTTAAVNQPAAYQYHMHGTNDIFLQLFFLCFSLSGFFLYIVMHNTLHNEIVYLYIVII